MKGSITVDKKAKFYEILKERNRVIKHYREKSQGLEELCGLLRCLLYSVLKSNQCSRVYKSDISNGLGSNLINITDDGESYYISVCDDLAFPESECNEQDEI